MCNTISCCGYFSQVIVEFETGALARWQRWSALLKQSLQDKGPDVCEGSAKGGGLHYHSRQNTHLSCVFGWYRKLTLLSRDFQQMSAVCLTG